MRRLVLLSCLIVTGTLAGTLAGAAPARADDVGDAIQEAQRAYRAGDLPAARTALEEALQFLSQRAAEGIARALPAALPGWTAQAPETSATGLAMLGGGSQVSRRYTNAQGQEVRIEVTADSPLIAQLAMVMNNPAMAGAMGRLVRIGNQRAIQGSDNNLQMLVDNRMLVSISGDAPVEAKLAYARAIDVAKLTGAR